jgi:hypothetical protein
MVNKLLSPLQYLMNQFNLWHVQFIYVMDKCYNQLKLRSSSDQASRQRALLRSLEVSIYLNLDHNITNTSTRITWTMQQAL